MSDVSGIPYMGPMGQGNFFAPTFSYNPQMSAGAASAGYAGPSAYAQNVTNNLYSSGGGFGTQTDYYSRLGASYLAQVPLSYENPYAGGGVPASLAYPGASLSGGYTTGSANMPSFDTGPNFGYTSGGAGALDLSRAGNLFSGGLGSGGGYSGPSIDWSSVGRAAAGMGADPSPGMSMPGGLNSPFSAPSGASPFSWSDLWGGKGGAYSSGIAPDTTGGRAPSVDWNNIQSPPTNYGTFQGPAQGGGGAGEYTSGIPPDTTGGSNFDSMPAPQWPQGPAKAQDQPAFDFTGGGVGGINAPAAAPSSKALLGYEPQQQPAEIDWNIFQSPATNYEKFQGPAQGGGQDTDLSSSNRSAQQLADDARARLATIIGSPETAKEEPGAAAIPLPRERPAEAPMPTTDRLGNPLYPEEIVVRPPAGLPSTGTPAEQEKYQAAPRPSQGIPFTVEPGKEARVAGVDQRLYAAVQGGAQYLPPGYSVEVFSGVRNKPGDSRSSQHYGGNAMDVRIIGPDGEILPRGNDYTGMYTLLARGVKTWTTQNDPGAVNAYGGSFETSRGSGQPDLMHFDRGPARGSLRPDLQFGNLKPLSEVEKNAMPAYIPALGENQVPLDRPVPLGPGYSAPVPPLTDRALPTVPSYRSSGMSAGDFTSAAPRFGDTLFGPYPAYTGSEAAPSGGGDVYSQFRRSENVEDRRSEQFMPEQQGPATVAPGAAPVSGFYGSDENIANRQITPEDAYNDVNKWNEFFYEATDQPTMPRDESLGPDPNPFKDFRQSPDIVDTRFDPALTDAQRHELAQLWPGASQGVWVETDAERETPIDGGKLGEMLGTGDISKLEAEASRRIATQGDTASSPPRAEDATFKERYWPTLEPDNTTGMRDFRSPANDYSAFQQPASRTDLAKTMTFGGGFSPSSEPRSGGVGPQATLEPDFMDVIQEVESSGDPDKVTGSYKGLYQLDDKEFSKYGGTGSIFDPEQNTLAAGAKMVAENQQVQDRLGRALTPPEQYMVHQQGVAGTLAHLANPDQLAWKNFQSASGWSEKKAKEAIWINMTPEMQKQFGNDVNNVTSRDFLRLWEDRYYGILNR